MLLGILLGALITAIIICSCKEKGSTFLDPRQLNKEQLADIQSLYSIGSGRLFGKGLERVCKALYVPDTYNDFIFAVMRKNWGL
jgi:cell division protein FtsW (lipid II flippase)